MPKGLTTTKQTLGELMIVVKSGRLTENHGEICMVNKRNQSILYIGLYIQNNVYNTLKKS